MLVLSRKKNESIVIDGGIVIEVLQIGRDQIRVGVTAPAAIKVLRGELRPFSQQPAKPPSNSQESSLPSSPAGELVACGNRLPMSRTRPATKIAKVNREIVGTGPAMAMAGGEIAGPLGEIAGPLGEIAGPLGEIAGPLGEIAGPLGEIAGPLGEIAVREPEVIFKTGSQPKSPGNTVKLGDKPGLVCKSPGGCKSSGGRRYPRTGQQPSAPRLIRCG